MRPPRCQRCKEPETLDKPLVDCVRCGRYYHPACHRPYPTQSVNWVCKSCLAGPGGRLGLYHEKLPSTTRTASHSSALSSRLSPDSDDGSIISMAPTAISDAARNNNTATVTAAPHQPLDSPSATIKCSFSGCPAKIEKHQVLCEEHLRAVAQNDSLRTFVQARCILPAPAPANGLHPARPTPSFAKPGNIVLPLMQRTPIIRRKTAVQPPPLKPQQPTPKASTPASRDDSTSFRSPPPPASGPSVHSPPPSPKPADGEPPRKRPRLSPNPDQSPQARLSSVAQGQQLAAMSPASGGSPLKPDSPHSGVRYPDYPFPHPGKPRDKEGKATPRLNGRHFMRRLPPRLTTLRFIDGPETHPPDDSNSGANGSTGASPRRTSGASELSSVYGSDNGSFARDVRTPEPPSVPVRPRDSPSLASRPASLPDGYSRASPPEIGTQPNTQNGYGPFRANFSSSHPPPQEEHLCLRPAPLEPSWKSRVPKPKEIDTSRFDALIYSQPGASSPPPEVELTSSNLPPPQARRPKDEPLYLDIDPRIHWPQPHSPAWHAAKRAEIRARGNRKANFGRAAQSLKKQLKQQETTSFEESLPEKIQENPAWVKMLKKLKGLPTNSSSSRSVSSRSSFSAGDGEAASWASRAVNGIGADTGQWLHRRSNKKTGPGPTGGQVTATRVGNSGTVVISGLSTAQGNAQKR